MSTNLDRIHIVQKNGKRPKVYYIRAGLSQIQKQKILTQKYAEMGYTKGEIAYLLISKKARLQANANNVSGYIGVIPFFNGPFSYGYRAVYAKDRELNLGPYRRCDYNDKDSVKSAYILACKDSDILRDWGMRDESDYLNNFKDHDFHKDLLRYEKRHKCSSRRTKPYVYQNFSITNKKQQNLLLTISSANDRISYTVSAKKADGKKMVRVITPDFLWFDDNLALALKVMLEPILFEMENHCTFDRKDLISWDDMSENVTFFIDTKKENILVSERFMSKLVVRCHDKARVYINDNKFAEFDYESKSNKEIEDAYRIFLNSYVEKSLFDRVRNKGEKITEKKSINQISNRIQYNLPLELFGLDAIFSLVSKTIRDKNKRKRRLKNIKSKPSKLQKNSLKGILNEDIIRDASFSFQYLPSVVKVLVRYKGKDYLMTSKKSSPKMIIKITKLQYEAEFKTPSRHSFEALFKRAFCKAVKCRPL